MQGMKEEMVQVRSALRALRMEMRLLLSVSRAQISAFMKKVAMPRPESLEELEHRDISWWGSKSINDWDCKVIAHLISRGALDKHYWLLLNDNQIGDVGLSALAGALSEGALVNLKTLDLSGNQIGDAGLQSLVDALSSGALDKLTRLNLRNNQIGNAGLQALADALSNGAMDKIQGITLDGNPGNSAPVEEALRKKEEARPPPLTGGEYFKELRKAHEGNPDKMRLYEEFEDTLNKWLNAGLDTIDTNT